MGLFSADGPIFGRIRSGVCATLTGAMLLQACAQPQIVNAPGDECAQFRAPLQQVVDEYDRRFQERLGGAAIAAIGAGVLTGVLTGDAGTGLAVGLAAGLTGAALAYYQQKQDQYATGRELQRGILTDMRTAQSETRSLSKSITELNACRLRQIEDARVLAVRGDKAVAEDRVASIRSWMSDDRSLVQQAVGEVENGADIYAKSYVQAQDRQVAENQRRSVNYTPRVRESSNRTTPPTVRRSRPRGTTETDSIVMEVADLQVESEAQLNTADARLDDVTALLQ